MSTWDLAGRGRIRRIATLAASGATVAFTLAVATPLPPLPAAAAAPHDPGAPGIGSGPHPPVAAAAVPTSTPVPDIGGSLWGSVTTATGAPLSGARVQLVSLATGARADTSTGSSGTYRLDAPTLGARHHDDRYQLEVSAPGSFGLDRLLRVPLGRPSRFDAALSSDFARLSGSVESAGGAPVAGAAVLVTGFADGATASTISASNGSFHLRAPALGSPTQSDQLRLQVRAPGFVTSDRLLRAPAGHLSAATVVLTPRASGGTAGTGGTSAATGSAGSRPALSPTPVPTCPGTADVWNDDTSDSSWETGGNWSDGVPTSASYVCIPSGVTGGVELSGTVSVMGLLVGSGETLTVTANGLTLTGTATASALQGSLDIDSSTSLSVAAGVTLLNASGGHLTLAGTGTVSGTFEQDAGVVATGAGDKPVDLVNGSSLRLAGTGDGAFEVLDPTDASSTVDLAGDVAAGQVLTIDAEDNCTGPGTTTLDAAAAFTNSGTISVSQAGNCTNGSVELGLPSGDLLTNAGTLDVAGPPGAVADGTQTFIGNLTNTGTWNVGIPGQPAAHMVLSAGDLVTNESALNVLAAAGASDTQASELTVAGPVTGPPAVAGARLVNGSGGTLTNRGTLAVSGTFTQEAGVVATSAGDNPVDLLNGSSLAFGGTGTGDFVVDDPTVASPTVALSGNLAPGQDLTIDAEDLCTDPGTTVVEAAASFTNAGTLAISQAGNCANGSATLALPTGDVLTNSGDLNVAGAPGVASTDVETIAGSVTNTGALEFGAAGELAARGVLGAGDTLTNEGDVSVAPASASSNAEASSLTVPSTAAITNGPGGVLTVGGTLAVSGTFTQDAGVVATSAGDNPVDLLNGSSLAFGGTGTGDFVVDDPTVASPTVALSGNLAPGQDLTIDAEDLCTDPGTTVVEAAASFTNAGTLAISQAGNCANGSATLALPTGDVLTNSGDLNVAGAPGVASTDVETITGSVTNTGTITAGMPGLPAAHLVFSAGDTVINQGTFTVTASPASSVVVDGTTSSVTNGAGGTLNIGGTFRVSGTFTQDAGVVATSSGDNPVDLLNGSSLAFGGTGTGAFVVDDPTVAGPTVALSGNLAPGQDLTIDAEDLCTGAATTVVDAAASFTSAGTVVISQAGNCSNGSATLVLPASGTITNDGTLEISGDPARSAADIDGITGSIANYGVFTVASTAQCQVSGSVTEASGSTFSAEILGSPTPDVMLAVAGTLTLGGGLDFATAPSASLSSSEVFHLFTDGSQTGDFAGVTGLSAGGDLAYSPAVITDGMNVTVINLSGYPFVTGLSPLSAPAGTLVTVYGTTLTGTTSVTFGGVPGTGITVVSSTELTVTVPNGTGTVPVVVTTPAGTTSSLGAPTFTYATTASGSPGSASLTVTVTDTAGALLQGVVVGMSDTSTRDPVGFAQTGADGTGTVQGLATGETVEVSVDENDPPYGSTSQVLTLVAGTNAVTLTLPIEPLVTDNPTTLTPNGDTEAVWPQTLPVPGTAIPGGALSQPAGLASVQFTVDYTASDSLLLAGDPTGTQPFCVDGDWTLTLIGPSSAPTSHTDSGTACPPSAGPLNLGTVLGLTTGTYGANLTLTEPTGASTYGSGPIYLLPPPGTVTNLVATPGSLSSPAVLGGSTSSTVGAASQLNVTLASLALPGVIGYHAIFGFDPAGIKVSGTTFPAGWNGGSRNNYANGDGGFIEDTVSAPSAIGSTVLTVDFTCVEVGSWPISFEGDYWLSGSSNGYAYSVSGTATVTCTAPAASSTPAAQGVSLDPTDGDVSVTVSGTGLSSATAADLVADSGAVVATSTSVTAAATIVTAHFATVAPGIYNLEVTDGSDVLAMTSGTPFQVVPALPYFSMQPVDIEGDVPGVATTHIYRVTNEGSLDGTGIFVFTYPGYLATEPTLASDPVGSELLLHGLSADAWVEYVAVPLDAGASGDVAFTTELQPSLVFGSSPVVPLGEAVPGVVSLAGQYGAPQWTTVSTGTDAQIVDGGMGAGMSAYAAALNTLDAMTPASTSTFMSDLVETYPDLAQGVSYLSSSLSTNEAVATDQTAGTAQSTPAPAPTTNVPEPPAPSTTTPTFDDGDTAAGSFGSYVFNTAEAELSDYAVNSKFSSTDANDTYEVTDAGSSSPTTAIGVGESTAYDNGTVTPVATLPFDDQAPGAGSMGLDSSWDASSQSVDLSNWTAGVTTTVGINDDGDTVPVAGLPFTSSGNGSSNISAHLYTGSVVLPGFVHPHQGGAAAPIGTSTADSATLGNAVHAVGGFLPSTPGLVAEWVVGGAAATGIALGLVPFWVGIGIIVGAWCLAGGCQGMWDGAHAVGSVDPNNITVSPAGSGSAGWVTPQPLTYDISFQNEPTATAAAQTVTITAQLDPNLDPSTVTFGDDSFAGTEPSFDPVTDTLEWVMPGIDLPPDTSPPDGEGYVSFSASPKAGVAAGTAINESAQVIFDYNPPVDTPTVTSTIDTTAPTASLSPLPPLEPPGTVTLNWSSTDQVGVALSELYESVNGGPLEPVASTTTTSATVAVTSGDTDAFAVEAAEDDAGLAGTAPTEAQGTFTVTAAPGAYTPITPVRICDTRTANPSNLSGTAAQCNGHRLSPNSARAITVAGDYTVPADATAVVVNLTAVNAGAKGYLTAYPTGKAAPTASNLNYTPVASVANLAKVAVGSVGQISVVANQATDLVVDLEGYVAPPSGNLGLYVPLAAPARICDTRPGNPSGLSGGFSGDGQCNGTDNAGSTLSPATAHSVQVEGIGGVPDTGVVAAVLNVTAVDPRARGYLSVYPAGQSAPTASNLNFAQGQVVPNRVIVPLSSSGAIDLISNVSTDALVDISGWYTTAGTVTGGQYTPEPAPVRICDTRPGNPSSLDGGSSGNGQCNGAGDAGMTIGAGKTLTINVTGDLDGVPADATAVVLNVTAINPTAQTHLTVYPGSTTPDVSDLNPAAGEVEANLVMATVSGAGTVTIYNFAGSVNLAADVAGWYQ